MEDFYTRVLEFTVTDRGQLPGASGPVNLVFLSRDPDESHARSLPDFRPRSEWRADMARRMGIP